MGQRQDGDEGKSESPQSVGTEWKRGVAGNTEDEENSSEIGLISSIKKHYLSDSETPWHLRAVRDDYPIDSEFICSECADYAASSLKDLRAHIEDEHDINWPGYVRRYELHRCAGCEKPLRTLERQYCDDCSQLSDDRVSCRNCGKERTNVQDPFCSSSCATERISATSGPPAPLAQPTNPSEAWLNHPYRLPTGVPSCIPHVANYQFTCQVCHHYGSDSLQALATHVAETHECSWNEYIGQFRLRTCRVCNSGVDNLLHLYCSQECQSADPDPLRTCEAPDCEKPVDRGQKTCTEDCYLTTMENIH